MKKLIFILFLFPILCFSQPRICWGGTAGYSTVPTQEVFVWGTFVNYEFNKKNLVTPLLGIGIVSWNSPTVNQRYFIPQAQVGVATKDGLVCFFGITEKKEASFGVGFYTGYQQFRIEYSETSKTIMFGTGYILK